MHVVVLGEDGKWTSSEMEDRQALRDIAFGPQLVWIRAGGATPEQFAQLGEFFDLHPLALEDAQNAHQRPKVEDYPGVTFVVVRVPRHNGQEIEWIQIGLFLGEGFVLTASPQASGILDIAERRLLAAPPGQTIARADRLAHLLLDVVVDAYFPFLHQLEDEVEDLEEAVITNPRREDLARIRDAKHTLSQTRRVVVPMRDAMLSLERVEHPNISAEARTYLRDVADHMIRTNEHLEHVKDLVLITQESWNSALANQQNEIMKRLTVLAGIILIPSLLAGLGGMNFADGFPDWSFPVVALIIMGLAVAGFVAARLGRWL
jgi:magnesium transporter